jgi:hypothetical protein
MHCCWDDLFLFVEFCNGCALFVVLRLLDLVGSQALLHALLWFLMHGWVGFGILVAALAWFLRLPWLTAALHCRFLCWWTFPRLFVPGAHSTDFWLV